MIRKEYNENTMPLGPDRYENYPVQQHSNGGRRKYAIQPEDEYNLEDNAAPTRDSNVARRQANVAEDGRISQNGKPQPRQSQSNYKKMERGISKAAENEFLINEARTKLEKDFGTLGLHSDISRLKGDTHDKYADNTATSCQNDIITETTSRAWVKNRYDRYEDTSGSSGNTSNSPTHITGSGSNSEYRIEGDNLVSNTGNFIENPVYTFILPDLTIYPGDLF